MKQRIFRNWRRLSGKLELVEPDEIILEIPDNSTQAEMMKQNHPRIYHWLNTGLGKAYLEASR